MSLREFTLIFRDASLITAQIMMIIGASALLSWILAREKVPRMVAEALPGLTDDPMVFILIIIVVAVVAFNPLALFEVNTIAGMIALAAEILLLGRHVSAQEAKEWGLINRIVPKGRGGTIEKRL